VTQSIILINITSSNQIGEKKSILTQLKSGFLALKFSGSVSSDCQGFSNLCGLWVGYAGVGVWVSLCQSSTYLNPLCGLAVYPPS